MTLCEDQGAQWVESHSWMSPSGSTGLRGCFFGLADGPDDVVEGLHAVHEEEAVAAGWVGAHVETFGHSNTG